MKFFAAALIVSSQLLAAAAVKVMPLGDSITEGGCWRATLYNNLWNAGRRDVDFVGTGTSSGCANHDRNHEGHSGFLAVNIANNNQLVGWLSSTRPDVVMMMLGTNDVWSNKSTQEILNAYSKLVDQMRASKSTMKILVAKILPMTPSNCAACNSRVIALNNAIGGWASGKSTSASPITVVDQYAGFNTATDTGDGVHPNANGDNKVAAKWYSPLVANLN